MCIFAWPFGLISCKTKPLFEPENISCALWEKWHLTCLEEFVKFYLFDIYLNFIKCGITTAENRQKMSRNSA